MKTIFFLSLCLSLSAFADFSDDHTKLCATPQAKKLMGTKGSCQIVIAPLEVSEVNGACEGKLSDITCRVLVLKTSESATMNLVCGEMESPLLTQVLEAEVISYNVSAVIKTDKGEYLTINDPREYHLLSNPALDVQISTGDTVNTVKGQMVLTIQNRSINLKDVTCH